MTEPPEAPSNVPRVARTILSAQHGLEREWLVTNGLGGYACGTLAGVPTRRYHGLLIVALPPPLGRMVMLNHLLETVRLPDGTRYALSGFEHVGRALELPDVADFRLESGLPIWTFRAGSFIIEKRLFLVHCQNTAQVHYQLLEGDAVVGLELCPAVFFRGHHDSLGASHGAYSTHSTGAHVEIRGGDTLPALRLNILATNASFTPDEQQFAELRYRAEEERGYDWVGDLWSPGRFSLELRTGHQAALIASTEAWERIPAPAEARAAEEQRREHVLAQAPPVARTSPAAELVLAADAFLVTPVRAEHAEVHSVIAGYPWFSDWGRDTMIALEGLTLSTGRHTEARAITSGC
ncbi:hypothetical protein AYO40_06685 [Planctomycetaceae bacterium SCGC AG-212-D15]|nr:hypothetical protein AYO40_06685 [Planctomycetaceae bacterium SCGC AG-212-D15]